MVIARNFGPRGGDLRCKFAQRVRAKKRRSARIDKNFIQQFKRVLARGCGRREYMDFAALAGTTLPEVSARSVACSHKCDAVTLLGRTLMSLWIANNMGQCVESFCNKRWDQLTNAISTFGSVTLGAALLNALLKYFVAVTALDVRQRLTRSVHKSWVAAVPHPSRNMLSAGCACAGTCTTWRTTRPTRWQTLTA